jgi:hypothetical protein
MSSPDTATSTPRPRLPSPLARLAQLKRALQKRLKRKPTTYERTLLDNAALLALRAETAVSDPHVHGDTIVRLNNAARRARNDFENICGLDAPKRKQQRPTLRELGLT